MALELAVEFALPLRLPDATAERAVGLPVPLAGGRGGGYLSRLPGPGQPEPQQPGSPGPAAGGHQAGRDRSGAAPGDRHAELRAVAPDWPARVADHDLAMTADSLRVLTARAGVHLIGYRELRDLQRRHTPR